MTGGFNSLIQTSRRTRLISEGTIESYVRLRELGYTEYYKKHVFKGSSKRPAISEQVAELRGSVRFLFLLLLRDNDLKLTEKTFSSLKKQLYPDWSVCVIHGLAEQSGSHQTLMKMIRDDARIREVRAKPGDEADVMNSAIREYPMEFVGGVNPGDQLSEDALFRVVKLIRQNGTSFLIYTDEDRIDENDHHTKPFFKPEFDP